MRKLGKRLATCQMCFTDILVGQMTDPGDKEVHWSCGQVMRHNTGWLPEKKIPKPKKKL